MGCSIVYPIFLFFTIYNFFVRLLALHTYMYKLCFKCMLFDKIDDDN